MKQDRRMFRIPVFLLAVFSCIAVVGSTQTALADYKVTLASIKNAIESDPAVGPHNVDVIYRQGRVFLKGSVTSEKSRDRVVEITKNTAGVNSVTDWLTVTGKTTDSYAADRASIFDDQSIEKAVLSAISSDSKGLGKKVSVKVSGGTASLSGNLSSFREADQALSSALMVAGVNEVTNELTVKGRPYEAKRFFPNL